MKFHEGSLFFGWWPAPARGSAWQGRRALPSGTGACRSQLTTNRREDRREIRCVPGRGKAADAGAGPGFPHKKEAAQGAASSAAGRGRRQKNMRTPKE
ncbi:hypothetical protein GCM10009090_06420 [[Pseudomonas] boreopolis]|uniref:Uncharacterized protein n=1 Tax=Xanthomonas boreopolis TaxID=86183 RepID=A0A919F5F1_9XANT|nr:hypothetical protein GCM10009090_06420 [[Pseudomonas] boreopolis]